MNVRSNDWWRGAVIYQIYPRSFYDSTGNGIGDLPGIIEKLDYVAALGVDGIWLSPFFTSPMKDYGYDVADYCDVDPLFGTLEDFDRLVERAHALGLKLIIDQVYSHSSDQHVWFQQSRQDRTNPKADWYVWAAPKEDGSPPNNWLSVFGGPAWSWDTHRRQYYLHNFLREQPDLNLRHPEVEQALLNAARFWLDRGVDGFRLDVANYYLHDEKLRDNPASGQKPARPYDWQHHLYNRSQPETLDFIRKLRALLDDYEGRMSVAEIFSADPIKRSISYIDAPDLLHTAYSFHYLNAEALSADMIREPFAQWTNQDAWPSWSFSNHDVPRVASRWADAPRSPAFAKLLNALLVCLRGTVFLYQGEELGLPQAEVPFDKLKDPEALRFWPETLGRDGCRTPLPWQHDLPHAGFSPTSPWLPVDHQHTAIAIDQQMKDQYSPLQMTRELLAWRKQHPALSLGDIRFMDMPEPVLCFSRTYLDQKLCCWFNLSPEATPIDPLPAIAPRASFAVNGSRDKIFQEKLLPPWGALLFEA